MRNVIIEFLSILVCVLENVWILMENNNVYFLYFYLSVLYLRRYLHHDYDRLMFENVLVIFDYDENRFCFCTFLDNNLKYIESPLSSTLSCFFCFFGLWKFKSNKIASNCFKLDQIDYLVKKRSNWFKLDQTWSNWNKVE